MSSYNPNLYMINANNHNESDKDLNSMNRIGESTSFQDFSPKEAGSLNFTIDSKSITSTSMSDRILEFEALKLQSVGNSSSQSTVTVESIFSSDMSLNKSLDSYVCDRNAHLSSCMLFKCDSCGQASSDSVVLLNCFHLMCEYCMNLKAIIDDPESSTSLDYLTIECPLCNWTSFTANHLDKTSKNESRHELIKLTANRRSCQSCLEIIYPTTPSHFCSDCRSFLCDKCARSHSFVIGCESTYLRQFDNWSREKYGELLSESCSDCACDMNCFQEAREFCVDCGLFLCHKCFLEDTRDCSGVSSRRACQHFRKITLAEWIDSKTNYILSTYRSLSDISEKLVAELNTNFSSILNSDFKKSASFNYPILTTIDILQRAMRFLISLLKCKQPNYLRQIQDTNLQQYLQNICDYWDKGKLVLKNPLFDIHQIERVETLRDTYTSETNRFNDRDLSEQLGSIRRLSIESPTSSTKGFENFHPSKVTSKSRINISSSMRNSNKNNNINGNHESHFGRIDDKEEEVLGRLDSSIKTSSPYITRLTASNSSNTNKPALIRHKMIYKIKFGDFGIDNSNFMEPSGLASNKNDRLYVADTNNHCVKVLRSDGKYLFTIGLKGELLYPNRVAVDPVNGNVVVSERCPSHQIQIFSSKGTFLRRFGSRIIQYPRGLAVDHQSRIIVVECKIMRIVIFDKIGSVFSKFYCSRQFQFPNNVAVNRREEIFISDNRLHRIQVFNYNGQFLRSIGCSGLINYPIGVEIDDKDRLVVADNHNNFNVTIFDSQNGQVLGAFESRTKHSQCYDITLVRDGEIFMSSKDFRIYQYIYNSPQSLVKY